MLGINLEGQVGIVTGAGTSFGIGRSMVTVLAQAGAKVVYACDLNISHLDSLKKIVADQGLKTVIEPRILDVASEEQTVKLLQEILRAHGRFDFFLANAGYAVYRSLDSLTSEQFARAVDVMQKAPFLAVKYGSQAMAVTSAAKPEAKGTIVITSSCAAWSGGYADIGYTAVKKACIGIVESGAVQVATNSKIRVVGVAPGVTKSSILTSSTKAEGGKPYELSASREQIAATHEKFFERGGLFEEKAATKYFSRTAEPEELANVAVFLVSDLAAAINGTVLLVDSGKVAAAEGEGFTGPVNEVPALKF